MAQQTAYEVCVIRKLLWVALCATRDAGAPTDQNSYISRCELARQQKQHKGWYSRGYLPHYDSAKILQSITFRLADSLPAHIISMLADDDSAKWALSSASKKNW